MSECNLYNLYNPYIHSPYIYIYNVNIFWGTEVLFTTTVNYRACSKSVKYVRVLCMFLELCYKVGWGLQKQAWKLCLFVFWLLLFICFFYLKTKMFLSHWYEVKRIFIRRQWMKTLSRLALSFMLRVMNSLLGRWLFPWNIFILWLIIFIL